MSEYIKRAISELEQAKTANFEYDEDGDAQVIDAKLHRKLCQIIQMLEARL